MPATRTQVYFTAAQRTRIDEIAGREGKTLAAVVRDALDAYLEVSGPDPREALRTSFGSMPELEVPSRDDWDRG